MKKFVVISHTHWDREWYMPFEAFRLKLVDLIDSLLAILEKDSEYIFHLDAQTVVLEDYLEIRPEKREVLKRYITSGNIVVGPWYLQNDFFLTSGESTVRNLIRGSRIAEEFGHCSKAGYAPDQFGNVSQLPQILKGFGIDTFIFGRGHAEYYTEDGQVRRRVRPTEFYWEGPDGSRCLAVYMHFWYNNAQHIPADLEKANLLLDICERNFETLNVSPYILLMNGVDHLEAQGDVREIIGKLRAQGRDVEQMRFDDYLAELKQYLKDNKCELETFTGAMDHGSDYELLRGCWSSKSYIKTANVRAQTMLENKLEPLYAFLEQSGMSGVFPKDHMDYLWKNLIKNHPHDSICCCSRDEVGTHMEDNYQKLAEMSEELLRRGMEQAAFHATAFRESKDNYIIAAFNPTEEKFTDVVELELTFPVEETVQDFKIYDSEGGEAPCVVLERYRAFTDVFSGVNLPGVLTTDNFRVLVSFKDVPAMSLRGYTIVPNETNAPVKSKDGIENEFYKIDTEGGRVNIFCKKSGVTVKDAIRFEDKGDRGDSYVFNPVDEPAVLSDPDNASVTVLENNALRKTIKAELTMRLAKRYDFPAKKQVESKVFENCSFTLTLKKGCDVLELGYEIDNRAEDHRLRIGIDTGVFADCLVTDSAFDFGEHRESECCPGAMSKTFCNATFAEVRAEGRGFAVLTEGLHEVERVGSTLYFSVVRATGIISRGDMGKQWYVPGNQGKRVYTGRLGLYGFASDSPAAVFAKAKQFRTGLLSHFTSMDTTKFAGGRFAVQDAKLEQLYYVPDPYEGLKISEEPGFAFANKNLIVTAYKGVEDGNGLIVRLVNFSEREQRTKFAARGIVSETNLAETENEILGEELVEVTFGPKQMRTFRITEA